MRAFVRRTRHAVFQRIVGVVGIAEQGRAFLSQRQRFGDDRPNVIRAHQGRDFGFYRADGFFDWAEDSVQNRRHAHASGVPESSSAAITVSKVDASVSLAMEVISLRCDAMPSHLIPVSKAGRNPLPARLRTGVHSQRPGPRLQQGMGVGVSQCLAPRRYGRRTAPDLPGRKLSSRRHLWRPCHGPSGYDRCVDGYGARHGCTSRPRCKRRTRR